MPRISVNDDEVLYATIMREMQNQDTVTRRGTPLSTRW
jgi:hypothetical protein